MDQKKIGGFLKELRKERDITQEKLAEQFNVSGRTVSRWETGNNLPDLDILIEISDYYEVDLREILNGERKSENMDKEVKETVLQAVDYANTEAEKCHRQIRICNAIGTLMVAISLFLKESAFATTEIGGIVTDIIQGFSIGLLLVGLIMSSRYGAKVKAFKQRIFGKTEA